MRSLLNRLGCRRRATHASGRAGHTSGNTCPSRNTNRQRRKRRLLMESLENRHLLAGLIDVRFEFVDDQATPVPSLQTGEEYFIRAFIQDGRGAEATGVRQAYFDINFNNVITTTGNPIITETYGTFPDGISQNGLIAEVGGIDRDSLEPNPADSELLFFVVPIRATGRGTLSLQVDEVDNAARRPIYFGSGDSVAHAQIDFLNTTIDVIGAGVTYSDNNNLQVTEGGTAATFGVALTQSPAQDVTFNINVAGSGQVTLPTTSLTFTPQNWDIAQTITVNSINDNVAEEPEAITLVTSPLQSSDAQFNGFDPADITVTLNDNDTEGVQIDPLFGLKTNETGLQDSVDVRLTSQPLADVTVSFVSNDPGEVAVSPASIVFTPNNWNFFQTLNFTGIDDNDVDGPQSVSIAVNVSSSDSLYNSFSVPPINVANEDLDVAALLVQPNAGLITGESEAAGGSDIFNVRLNSRPSSDVFLNLASSDPGEGTPAQTRLTFTPSNWDQIQVVRVNGVDDLVIDGHVSYQVTVTPDPASDPTYRNLSPSVVMLTNRDDDSAALNVSTPNQTFTTEAGAEATFTVQLRSQPSGTVAVNVTSNMSGEATVQPASLTFNSTNWNSPRTVTVSGVDDQTIDGDASFNVNLNSVSDTDTAYNGLSQSIALINRDDDVPGVTVTNASDLTTSEAGQTDTFSVRLDRRPIANVTIRLASTNTNEVTVAPTALTFTPANWDVDQTVTLSGVNDGVIDGDANAEITFNFSTSEDASYRNFTRAPLSVTNQGDQARLLVQPLTGLVTSEATGTDQSDMFSVRLTRQPATDVFVTVVSSDTSEGTPDAGQLIFTPQNFDQPQTVIVTGADDDSTDGDQAYQVILTTTQASDPAYRDLSPTTVMLTNLDNDVPSLVVGGANPGSTTEAGGTSQILVRLQTQPTGTVQVTAISSNTGEGTVSGSPLTFKESNWDENQFITVTGVNDERVDGNIFYQITLTPSSTTDTNYNSASLARTVSLTNTNDDIAAVKLSDVTDLRTDESGLTDSFAVRLQKQPLGNVTIALASSNTNEVTVAPTTLNFTPANWDQNQTVTLTGVDDGLIVDGNQTANITLNLTQSADAAYANVSVDPLVVTNVDNDVPSVNVVAANPIVVTETGTTGTFTISLATPPTGPVTITAFSQDTSETLVSATTAIFTAANFDQPQTFTVTGVDDELVDEDVISNIVLSATSADTAYNEIAIDLVRVRTLNDDVGNVRVIADDDLTTNESGTTVTFEVSLAKQPAEEVSVPISVGDATELSINVNTPLVFTPSNWNVPQTVTVTGLADGRVDADVVSQVQLGPTTSTDADFNDLDVAPVSVTNANVDSAVVVVTGTNVLEGNPGEAAVLQFSIRLDGAVESGVSLDYSALAGTSGVAATPGTDFNATSGTATFTGDDGETLTINIAVAADGIVESNESVVLRVSNLVASGSGINLSNVSLPTTDATARIMNDDTATIILVSGSAVFEGDADDRSPITATVDLSAAVQGGVTIDFTTSDAAATIADNDYVATNGTFSLGGNAPLSQTISVDIIGDETPEADESLNLALSNLNASDDVIQDAITIINSPAALTILNDDAPRLILRNITTDNAEGGVADSRTFRFEVELTDTVEDGDGFSVPITTVNGTANSESDFNAVDTVLNFSGSAGETRTIDVAITGDGVVEHDETFSVRLGAISGLAQNVQVVIPTPEISATIANDDTASIRLTASQTTVTEGATGTTSITFTATLDGEVDSGFQIGYAAADFTATVADADYVAANGSLTFTGQTSETQTFDVLVNGDSKLETDESFSVALGEVTGLSDMIASSIVRPADPIDITILADDRATLSIQDATAVNEGGVNESAELAFTVSLSALVDNAFNLAFSTNDTGNNFSATGGSDYDPTSGQLTFDANSTATQTIRVPVRGDAMVEPDEIVEIALGDLTGLPAGLTDFIDIERSVATGEIQNDDSATFSIQGPTQISEPGGSGSTATLTYTVALSAPVQGGVSVAYATNDGTATSTPSARDFTATSGILTFNESGDLQRTLTVNVLGDSSIENSESFTVRLGELSNVPTDLAASITVTDQPISTTLSDDDSVTVSFADAGSTVAETDGVHEVSVVLTTTGGAILEQPLAVDVVVRSSSSADSNDFTITTTRVTFPAGSSNGSSQIVRITLNDESLTEPTETIVLGLQPVDTVDGVIVGATDHTVSVTDDPGDATLSGGVWADTNANGSQESHEMPIAGITIRLTGTDRQGESVSRQTITDATGRYQFGNLAAGTYTVTQDQPAAFHDGATIVPAVTYATTTANQISTIQIEPSQQLGGHHFTERGYRAASIPVNAFTARKSTVNPTAGFGNASPSTGSSPLDEIFANW